MKTNIQILFCGLLLTCLLPGQTEEPAWRKQTRSLITAGRFQEALTTVEGITKDQPQLAGPHLLRGFILLRLNRPTAAKRAYERARQTGAEGEAWAGIANAAYSEKNYQEALTAAGKALGKGQHNLAVLQIGGLSLLALARPAAAVPWFRQACVHGASEEQNWVFLARALTAAGRPAEAAREIREAIATFGHRAQLVRILIGAYIAEGRTGEAADLLTLLHLTGEAKPKEIGALGDLQLRLGNTHKALELYALARTRGLTGPGQSRRLALAWWHAGDLDRAAKILSTVKKELSPADLVEFASLQGQRQKFAAALSLYQEALAKAPELATAHLGIGQTYLAMDRLDKAEKSFRKLLSMSRKQLAAHLGLAQILKRQGKLHSSLAQLRRARLIDPGNAVIVGQILQLERTLQANR